MKWGLMNSGSVTHWIEQVKAGSESVAEQELWNRYFSRLAALARSKLEDLPPQIRDEEDLALSVLHDLFQGVRRGSFPRLHDRTDLWQLLAKITIRKSIDRRRHSQAQKRGSGRVRNMDCSDERLIHTAINELTPDSLAEISDERERLMATLDDELRPIAEMKLQGYTNAEVAERLGRVERTVERKLERIRHTWLKEVDT